MWSLVMGCNICKVIKSYRPVGILPLPLLSSLLPPPPAPPPLPPLPPPLPLLPLPLVGDMRHPSSQLQSSLPTLQRFLEVSKGVLHVRV